MIFLLILSSVGVAVGIWGIVQWYENKILSQKVALLEKELYKESEPKSAILDLRKWMEGDQLQISGYTGYQYIARSEDSSEMVVLVNRKDRKGTMRVKNDGRAEIRNRSLERREEMSKQDEIISRYKSAIEPADQEYRNELSNQTKDNLFCP